MLSLILIYAQNIFIMIMKVFNNIDFFYLCIFYYIVLYRVCLFDIFQLTLVRTVGINKINKTNTTNDNI